MRACRCAHVHTNMFTHTCTLLHTNGKLVSKPRQVGKIHHHSSELLSSKPLPVRCSREEFCRGQPLIEDVEGGWGFIRVHHCFLQPWGADSASQQRDVGGQPWKSPFQVLQEAVTLFDVIFVPDLGSNRNCRIISKLTLARLESVVLFLNFSELKQQQLLRSEFRECETLEFELEKSGLTRWLSRWS